MRICIGIYCNGYEAITISLKNLQKFHPNIPLALKSGRLSSRPGHNEHMGNKTVQAAI